MMEKQCNGRPAHGHPSNGSSVTSPWVRNEHRSRDYIDRPRDERRSRGEHRSRDHHERRSRSEHRDGYGPRDDHRSSHHHRHRSRGHERDSRGDETYVSFDDDDYRPRDHVSHSERHTLPRARRDPDYGATSSTAIPVHSKVHVKSEHDRTIIHRAAYNKPNGRSRTSDLGPWNRCVSDSTLDGYPERHVRFAVHSVPPRARDVTTHPRDGCLLLGREGYMWTKYATTFYLKNRIRQCKVVKREVLRDNFSSFLHLPESQSTPLLLVWHFIKSMPFLMLVWTSIFILQASKCALPPTTPGMALRVNLGLTLTEMFITCAFIVINVLAARDKFKRAENERIKLEQMTEESNAESAAEFRVWMYLLVAAGIFSCAFLVMFVIVMAVTDALAWSILTNGFAAALMFAASRLTLDYYERIVARIQLDHHKIVLFEALLHVGKQYWTSTPDQRRRARENVRLFIQSLQGTKYFGRPDYVAYPSDCQWDVVTGIESGV